MNVAILGGGISGISLAHFLLNSLRVQNLQIHLFDKGDQIGGLCQTIDLDGFKFDFGPHNIHSTDQVFNSLMVGFHGKKYKDRTYQAQVSFMNKFVPYPMEGTDILRCIPLHTSLACAASFLWSRFRSLFREWDDNNFENYMINRFGPKLYNIYFGPFTKKTWGVPGSELSADFARDRIGTFNLWDLFQRTFLGITPRTLSTAEDPFLNTKCVYHDDGSQPIVDAFLNSCLSDSRFFLHKSSIVSSVETSNNKIVKVSSASFALETDFVFSTIPVCDFAEMIGVSSNLRFTATRFLLMTIDKKSIFGDTPWVYFSDNSTLFNRVYEPRNMSSRMSPEGKTSLCFEFTSNVDDDIWRMTDVQLKIAAISGLENQGLLKEKDVLNWRVINWENTYPLRLVNYQSEKRIVFDQLDQFENLESFGRLGGFAYLNMDHCIMLSLSTSLKFSKVVNSVLGV